MMMVVKLFNMMNVENFSKLIIEWWSVIFLIVFVW